MLIMNNWAIVIIRIRKLLIKINSKLEYQNIIKINPNIMLIIKNNPMKFPHGLKLKVVLEPNI